MGVGLFPSYTTINDWLKDVRTIPPIPENTTRYAPYLQLYLELYQRNKVLMHRLGALRE